MGVGFGIDADLEVGTQLTGTVAPDGRDVSAVTAVTVDCSGSGCGLIELALSGRFPCEQSLTLDLAAP